MNKVDMSLDDIIKMKRKQKKQTGNVAAGKVGKKGNPMAKGYITKQALQKKLQNKPKFQNQWNQNQQNKIGKFNLKPKPKRPQQQNQQRSKQLGARPQVGPKNKSRLGGAGNAGATSGFKYNKGGTPKYTPKRLQRKGIQTQNSPKKGGQKLSLIQQKALKVQERIDRRRRLQQNRMKVNRPGTVGGQQISDAKLLKMAKALLLEKAAGGALGQGQQKFSARQLQRQQQSLVQETITQTSPNKRKWNRRQRANIQNADALITVNVKNDLVSPVRRNRLQRPPPSTTLTIGNPRAKREPNVHDIVRSMKPKVEMFYDFSKEVFCQGKTSVGLSDRFSGASTGKPAPGPGSRQVYL